MHQVPSFVVDGVTLTQSVSNNELYLTAVNMQSGYSQIKSIESNFYLLKTHHI